MVMAALTSCVLHSTTASKTLVPSPGLCSPHRIAFAVLQALSAPQKVVIDLDFPGMMSPSEVKSLLQQLSYSYSAAVSGQQQLHLHLLGATGVHRS
jgi:hypothetical protein